MRDRAGMDGDECLHEPLDDGAWKSPGGRWTNVLGWKMPWEGGNPLG